jgi:alkylhydroperoxidase family enzyme
VEGAKEGSSSAAFDEREKAALALCEESTRDVKVSDATFDAVKAHYSEPEIVELLGVISVINMWNRLMVALGF